MHVLEEHDSKVKPVGEVDIADTINTEDDKSGLSGSLYGSTLQSSGVMDIVVVLAVQRFDRFKPVPYLYPVPGLELFKETLGELMLTRYYTWDRQVMLVEVHARSTYHSQQSVQSAGGTTPSACAAMNLFSWMKQAILCQ